MRQFARATFLYLIIVAGLAACSGGTPPPPAPPPPASTDASLAGLGLSQGMLAPAFQSAVTAYDVTVAAVASSVTVTPTTTDAGATVTVDGNAVNSGAASPAIALNTGDNTISVVVTAEDGTTTRTYTLSIYRLSDDTTLSGLSPSSANLDQMFQSATFNYTATVGFLQTREQVTAAVTHANATLTINSNAALSGVQSGDIALAVGQNIITVTVTAEDGIATQDYVIDVTRQDAPSFAQQAYTKASNTDAGDSFGYSVAVNKDSMAVGAYNEASTSTGINGNDADNGAAVSGGVFVFTRDTAGTWTQQAYVKASNTDAGDRFGFSVALSGDTLAVGAPYEDSATTGINGNEADDTVAQAGAVYVFTRNAGVWTQQAYVKASNTGASDLFGGTVVLSGDTMAVGAHQEDSSSTGINGGQGNDATTGNSGAVYVFTRNAGTWSQEAYIKASNTGATDFFGYYTSVALSGDTLAVGAYAEASSATGINGNEADNSMGNSGAAYVFTRTAGTWSQQAYVKASNTNAGDTFGQSVALSGDTLVVGAHFEDSNAVGVNGDDTNSLAPSSGAAYIFARNAGVWSQQAYLKASNTASGDRFGASVALSDDALAVFAQGEDGADFGINGTQTNNSSSSSGAVYAFVRDAGVWTQHFYIKSSNSDANDEFGWSLAISADTLAVGSQFEDSVATGINGNEADNTALESGAAYVFE
ncbi:MAG: cadherin-like beta sandwich domain-containing protein [Candidatus Tectomicrobia bacterium]